MKTSIDHTEIWTLINLSADTHLMHVHLPQFEVLERRKFKLGAQGVPAYQQALNAARAAAGGPVNASGQLVNPDPKRRNRVALCAQDFGARLSWHDVAPGEVHTAVGVCTPHTSAPAESLALDTSSTGNAVRHLVVYDGFVTCDVPVRPRATPG